VGEGHAFLEISLRVADSLMHTILNVAFPLAPVGPDAVGGAEQVLWMIDAGLTSRGYRSVVIACAGSELTQTLVPLPEPPSRLDESARRAAQASTRDAICEVLAAIPIDVIHLHGIDFHEYLPPDGPPALATLHLPTDWYPPAVFHPDRPGTFLNLVSHSQRRRLAIAANVRVIENGVPIPELASSSQERNFVLSVGRICPEKNFHVAMLAAKRAQVPFILAGRLFGYEAHERYFSDQIVPLLDASCQFIGPVGLADKQMLLRRAGCLLVPSLAAETSSLVSMEAIACGTPVVAFPSGSLSEIVEHGRTGFLVNNMEEMCEAISQCRFLDSEECREAARRRFSAERMIQEYLDYYAEIVQCSSAKSPTPAG
jgi:glycosyltransferase involved in cell wall biosynthesis